MQSLLEEYQESLELTKQMRKNAPEEDQKIYASMLSNLYDAVKWLKDKQEPRKPKTGRVFFRNESTIEQVGSVDIFNPFASNAYREVERRIDEERGALK